MKKIKCAKTMKWIVFFGTGLVALFFLLSAGAIAQNSPVNNASHIHDTDLHTEQEMTLADQIAELKAQIAKLEAELQKRSYSGSEQIVEHDHANGAMATTDMDDTQMSHDDSMEGMHMKGCMGMIGGHGNNHEGHMRNH